MFISRAILCITPILVLGLLAVNTEALAEIYKWTDENGVVHYGERPPASAKKKQQMQINNSSLIDEDEDAPSAEERRKKQERLLKIFDEERAEKKRITALVDQAVQERKQQCFESRNKVAKYQQSGVRWYYLDDNGEHVWIDNDEVVKIVSENNAYVAENCSDAAYAKLRRDTKIKLEKGR